MSGNVDGLWFGGKAMKKLEFSMEPGEIIAGIGINDRNQLVVWSSKKKVWISTDCPIEYIDMVEITKINKGANDGRDGHTG